jgi:hypothetical protein
MGRFPKTRRALLLFTQKGKKKNTYDAHTILQAASGKRSKKKRTSLPPPPKTPNFGLSVSLSVRLSSRLVHVVATAQIGKFATLQAGASSRVYKIRSLV